LSQAVEQIQATESGELARGKLGTFALSFLGVSASGPMIVIAGAFGAILALTGNVGSPWAYLGIGAALVVWMVGYNALVRRMGRTSAAFATYIARGLGRPAGAAAGYVAIVAYNGIQIGLYGLFGFSVQGFAATHASWAASVSWWQWALIVWAVVAILGWLKIELSARILAVFLALELVAAVLFDLGGFIHPAGGSIIHNLVGVTPHGLFATGALGTVFTFVAASFVGVETPPNFAEEARDPATTVPRSTYWSAGLTTGLYAVSMAALIVHMGQGNVVKAAQDPTSGIPFSLIESDWGKPVAVVSNLLLLTSMFAAMLSFHNSTARYFFVAGRERTLFPILGRINTRTEAPSAGSATQSAIALVTILVFGPLLHLDPFTKLFTWYSYIGGLGVMVLMLATAVATVAYFARGSVRQSGREDAWQRIGAPVLSGIVLTFVCVLLLTNNQNMLGVDQGSVLRWVMPAVTLVPAVAGMLVALWLRAVDSNAYAGIGYEGNQLAGPAAVPVRRAAMPGYVPTQHEAQHARYQQPR
jgi:amino acid transporter